MADKKNTLDLLLAKYPPSEYALMSEVRNGAGFEASNSADFVALSYWPSRGLSLIGIERKSHRSDWLRELKNAQKAEGIFGYCDYFYLLTDGVKVATLEEIPEPWGWMDVSEGGKLRVIKEAPRLKPIPLDRSFVTAMVKRAADRKDLVHKSEIEERLKERFESGQQSAHYKVKRLEDELKAIRDQVKEFEDAAGIKLNIHAYGYNSETKKVGEAVKFVLKNGSADQMRKELLRIGEAARGVCLRIEEGLKAFEQNQPQQ